MKPIRWYHWLVYRLWNPILNERPALGIGLAKHIQHWLPVSEEDEKAIDALVKRRVGPLGIVRPAAESK